MANQALIKGELGVYTQPTFKGDLIAKPIAAAMDNFIKADQARKATNAKRAGEIEKKALDVQNGGKQNGVTPAVSLSGQKVIIGGADVFRKTGDPIDLAAAENIVDNVNHGYDRFLDQNANFVDLVGEDGEIEVGNWYDLEPDNPGAGYPPGVSRGSDWSSMNNNLAIFGGDKNVLSEWNPETEEFEFYNNPENDNLGLSGEIGEGRISQSDLNKGIFKINDKFGSMMTAEATRQGSKNMTGTSRYVDYNKNLRSKGDIISAFYDEMIPGVPSVYDHLKSQDDNNWIYGTYGSTFDGDKAKEQITKYYDQILSNEQANYVAANPEEDNKTSRTPTEKDMDVLYKQAITENVNGNFTGTYGSRSVRNVEWRKHPKYDTNDKYTFLFDKDTGAKVGEFNFEDNPEQKSHIYISGNSHFFFNANDPADVKRFGLRMKQI